MSCCFLLFLFCGLCFLKVGVQYHFNVNRQNKTLIDWLLCAMAVLCEKLFLQKAAVG